MNISSALGTVFNYWTIIDYAGRDKNSNKLVVCQCKCGIEKIVRFQALRSGRSTKCKDCYTRKFRLENDLSGQKFNKWTVLYLASIRRRNAYYMCECDCGRKEEIAGWSLNKGRSGACPNCRVKTHGMTYTSTYKIWRDIISRCTNPNLSAYKYYGGRGIKICDRWKKFENFLEDMGERPEGLSIDRIDNDGHYEPGNCRWTTWSVQAKNKRKKKE